MRTNEGVYTGRIEIYISVHSELNERADNAHEETVVDGIFFWNIYDVLSITKTYTSHLISVQPLEWLIFMKNIFFCYF